MHDYRNVFSYLSPHNYCTLISCAIGVNKPPEFDVAKHYRPEDIQDMLVRNTYLGGGLASNFSSATE
jgi:hypothetical protein